VPVIVEIDLSRLDRWSDGHLDALEAQLTVSSTSSTAAAIVKATFAYRRRIRRVTTTTQHG
jgi:hypothetical protein